MKKLIEAPSNLLHKTDSPQNLQSGCVQGKKLFRSTAPNCKKKTLFIKTYKICNNKATWYTPIVCDASAIPLPVS